MAIACAAVCYYHKNDFGFMRFLQAYWSDPLAPPTPSIPIRPTALPWFHDTSLLLGTNGAIGHDLPSRRYIFEFKLIRAEQDKGLRAVDIQLVAEL